MLNSHDAIKEAFVTRGATFADRPKFGAGAQLVQFNDGMLFLIEKISTMHELKFLSCKIVKFYRINNILKRPFSTNMLSFRV